MTTVVLLRLSEYLRCSILLLHGLMRAVGSINHRVIFVEAVHGLNDLASCSGVTRYSSTTDLGLRNLKTDLRSSDFIATSFIKDQEGKPAAVP